MGEISEAGFRWDTGPSVITMRHVFERLFNSVKRDFNDYVQLLPVHPITRYFWRDGLTLDAVADPETMCARIAQFAPGDVDGYRRFLRYDSRLRDLIGGPFLYRQQPSLRDLLKLPLADALHISGPLAMVVAGLVTGSKTSREKSMSATTEQYLDRFWELLDMGLNAILFLLIGLRLVGLEFNGPLLILGIVAIITMLLARFITVKFLSTLFRKTINTTHREQIIVVWSGLKGGLSLAMALSIPHLPVKEPIVFITYAIVLFSIIVQGLSIEWVVRRNTRS